MFVFQILLVLLIELSYILCCLKLYVKWSYALCGLCGFSQSWNTLCEAWQGFEDLKIIWIIELSTYEATLEYLGKWFSLQWPGWALFLTLLLACIYIYIDICVVSTTTKYVWVVKIGAMNFSIKQQNKQLFTPIPGLGDSTPTHCSHKVVFSPSAPTTRSRVVPTSTVRVFTVWSG